MSTNDTKQRVTLSEHLSSLFDDEAGDFESKRVLDELKTDDELSRKLANYALIKETMHSSETNVIAQPSFLQGIHDKLEAEPEYSSHALDDALDNVADATNATNKKQSSSAANDTKGVSWLRPVGGFAMAASVAALAVIGFQNYSNTQLPTESAPMEMAQKASASKNQLTRAEMDNAVLVSADTLAEPVGANKSASTTEYQQADARTRSLLKRYVDSHMQYASTSAFVPSVRVIAYSDY